MRAATVTRLHVIAPSRAVLDLVVKLGVIGALCLYAATFRHAYLDDSYITFGYARTLIQHHIWGMTAYHAANTATSPPNVILIALFGLLCGSVLTGAVLYTAALLGAMLALLLSLSTRLTGDRMWGGLAFLALALNPLLMSTIGLESLLYVTVLLACLRLVVAQRFGRLAAALALLTLIRPDGVLLFALLLASPLMRGRRIRCAAIYFLVLAPWYLFSWTHLGGMLPDTFVIKTGQPPWSGFTYWDGLLLYAHLYPWAIVGSVALLPPAVLALRVPSPARALLRLAAVYGLAHYVGYSLMRVPPYHWYYTSEIAVICLAGSFGLVLLVRRWTRQTALGAAIAALLLMTLSGALLIPEVQTRFTLTSAPVTSNWASPSQYRAVGLWLRRHIPANAEVDARMEIGTVAYYSERNLENEFSDSRLTNAVIANSPYLHSRLPVVRYLYMLNFLFRPLRFATPTHRYLLAQRIDGQSGRVIMPHVAGPPLHVWRFRYGFMGAARLTLWRLPRNSD